MSDVFFQRVYHGFLNHPGVAWLCNAIFLAALLMAARRGVKRHRFLQGYAVIFAAASMIDAWFTSALSPLPRGSALLRVLTIVFVVIGDFRFFIFVEHYSRGRARLGREIGTSLGLSLIVPIASTIAMALVPRAKSDERVLFLLYELMFLALVAALRPFRWGPHALPGPWRRWLARVVGFELAIYAVWAAGDAVLLLGKDWGYLLRLVANALYYGLFVIFVYETAPKEEAES